MATDAAKQRDANVLLPRQYKQYSPVKDAAVKSASV
jgi:hypothetical protein